MTDWTKHQRAYHARRNKPCKPTRVEELEATVVAAQRRIEELEGQLTELKDVIAIERLLVDLGEDDDDE